MTESLQEARARINRLKFHLTGPLTPELIREIKEEIVATQARIESGEIVDSQKQIEAQEIKEIFEEIQPQILEDVGGDFLKALQISMGVANSLGIKITEPDQLNENWQELE